MRIVFVTPLLPFPADSGSRTRKFQILRMLRKSHDVTVLSFETGDVTRVSKELGLPVTVHPVRTRRGWGPFHFDEATPRSVWEAAEEWRADVVHLEGTFAAAAAGLPRTPPPLPVILDDGCVHHISYRREASLAPTAARRARALVRWWRLRRFERRLARVPYAVAAVSQEEAAYLRHLAPSSRVVVAPNGVDPTAWRPSPPGDAILFVGLMSYPPNRDAVRFFVTEVLPHLNPLPPGSEFLVAGRDPGPELEELTRTERRFHLLGFIPELQPLYNRAAVFVNPMRGGGGTRTKVLEAMAAGKAVVSTTIGVEGLAVTPGRDVIVANTPVAFAEAVQRLLADPHKAWEVGHAGRALVEARYNWENCLAPLERLYAELSPAQVHRC